MGYNSINTLRLDRYRHLPQTLAEGRQGEIMKLIIAIIRDEDSEAVSRSLVAAGFRVTRIASTGGFLRRGSTTFMIGVEEDKLDAAIQLIRDTCTPPADPAQKRATLFVLNIARFEQL
jgi:uncharacterized protein YaaQ